MSMKHCGQLMTYKNHTCYLEIQKTVERKLRYSSLEDVTYIIKSWPILFCWQFLDFFWTIQISHRTFNCTWSAGNRKHFFKRQKVILFIILKAKCTNKFIGISTGKIWDQFNESNNLMCHVTFTIFCYCCLLFLK